MWSAVLVCLLLNAAPSAAPSAAPAVVPLAGEPLLTESFDGAALPQGWTVTGGQWAVAEGRLHVTATDYLSRIVLPVPPVADVAVEADAAFVSAKNPGRWLALMGRKTPGRFAPFTIFTSRFDRTQPNGVEIGHGSGDGPKVTWNVVGKAATTVPAETEKPHRLRVEFRGSTARAFIDGALVLIADVPDRDAGEVGLVASDVTAWFDNVKVEKLAAPTPAEVGRLGGAPLVVAHRGNSRFAPENTLISQKEAYDLGADVVECDVRRTKDGQLVILHDGTFQRTAGNPGKPEDMTLDEIRKLDAGSWKDAKYAGEKIPTLAEMLDLAKQRGSLLLDLKQTGLTPDIAALVKERHVEDRIILGPWSADEAAAARRDLPDCAVTLIGAAPRPVPDDWFWPLLQKGVRGFNTDFHTLTPEFVSGALRRGMPVFAWTVDDAGDMLRLAKMGVSGILTDDPGLLRKTLDEWTAR